MGQVKLENTRYLPCQPPQFSLKGVHPDWEVHPSWITGIEALNAYNYWVSEVVLPIAFQWIEEHHDEVYASVPADLKADVGVVIAAAFELVKNLPAYQDGLVQNKKYEQALEDGTWDPTPINPVWAGIAREVRTATAAKFDAQKAVLKETIR